MKNKEPIKYFTHPENSIFAGMQIRENPDDAFENAIKRGMKNPEDWICICIRKMVEIILNIATADVINHTHNLVW